MEEESMNEIKRTEKDDDALNNVKLSDCIYLIREQIASDRVVTASRR